MSETRRTIGKGVRAVLSTACFLLLGWALPWSAALAQPAYQGQETGTVNATSITLATPTGTVQNDLLLATISTRGGAVSAVTAGWTLVAQQTQGTETLAVFYQRYNATTDPEEEGHEFSWGTSARAAGAILRYTGVDIIQAVDASGIAAAATGNATAPSVTTTVGNTTVIRVAGTGITDNTAPGTPPNQRVSIVAAGFFSPDAGLGVADLPQVIAGSSGTAAFTNTSANWVAVTIALRPFIDTLCASSPGSGSTTLTGGILNTYYPGTTTASAGAVSIAVGTARGATTSIAAGDLLLVIQMQDATINTSNDERYGDGTGTAGNTTGSGSGATNYNNAGLYEFVVAKGAVAGGVVPVEGKGTGGGLINTYTDANATTTQGQRRFQVVRVPQYFDATVTGTITAAAWNGTSGGIVAIDAAGTLTFSGGAISVNTLGFRGGGGQGLGGGGGANTDYRTRVTVANNGNKGEGVAGSPNSIYDGTGTLATGTGYPSGTNSDASRARGAPGNAGGGGTDGNPGGNDENSGGGGGGNGGAGGLGGRSWQSNLPLGGFGGAAFPHAPARLAMGGGGGSGSRNNSADVQSSGGLGGGIIIVRANSVTGTGTLSANGGWPATDNYTPANDGGGGGGAGGSVLVFARTGGLTGLTVNARGAVGANAWPAQAPGTFPGERHGPGGGGAGGVVYLSSAAGTTSVTGAANGTTTTAVDAYGATAGADGSVNTVTEPQIPGAGSGGTCKATLACVAGFGATAEAEQVFVRWETACEIGTAGFHVERLDPDSGGYVRVNETVLPALLTAPRGGFYSLVDPGATPGKASTYRLVEQEVWGGQRVHGPFTVTPGEPTERPSRTTIVQGLSAADEVEGYDDPVRGYRAVPRHLDDSVVTRTAVELSSAGAAAGLRRAAAQIQVRQDGLLHASVAQLAQALGSTEASVRAWLRTGALELTSKGEPVAWLPDTATEGAAEPSGLFFYGEATDSLFTRDNVYRVRASFKGTAMGQSDGAVPPLAVAGAFTDRVTVEQDRFAATVVATDPNSDYWHWEAFIGGTDVSWSTKRFTVGLPHVAGDGTIKVFLKGAAVGVHVVRVSVNGHLLGEASWQDLQDYELRLPVTASRLQSGGNSVEVRALGGDDDIFYLDRIEMEYRRMARAVDDRLTLTAESDGPLAVDGFGASDIRVFDLGDPKRPVLVTATSVGPGAVGQSVSFNAQQGRRYLALAGAAIGRAAFQPMTAADLQFSRDRVDYLVIAAPELRGAAQELADYREARGLASRVVGTDEIYDSFSWGMATPEALRDFLRFATRSWGVRFVVLAGPGTFDYRDLGDRLEPQVPTLMTSTPSGLFACDTCLVDIDGNGAPDVPISRIPASTAAGLRLVLGKVSAFEKSAAPLRQARILLLADRSDPAAGSFSRDSDSVAQQLPSGMTTTRAYLDESPLDGVRAALFEGMNESASWVNYIGHGGADRFGGSEALLTVNDLGALRKPEGPLPVVSALTCAANRFEVPGFAALGERLLLHDGGGAVAVWAATSLSLNDPAVRLGRDLFTAAFKLQARTLGEAVQQSLRENTDRRDVPAYLLRTYALLGDAAMQLSW